jgi:redox-sensitive bicupin YhaK (pirin superfamily)
MIKLRKSQERGYAGHGWLKSYHSFSFADYYDPDHMGWGNLRVINEDYVAPGTGFGKHGHRDMEIVTYVTAGLLSHQDSMGNGTSIPAGDVQRMSAGRGVLHSEFNHSPDETTHLFQIWIEPKSRGIEPGYEQKAFDAAEKRGQLRLIASPDGAEGSITIHAEARLYAGLLDGEEAVKLSIDAARKAYIHLIRGSLEVNGHALQAGDAALIAEETDIALNNGIDAEVLVFDLAQ